MHDPSPVMSIERPEPALFTYYFLCSLLLGPFFFLYLIPMYFRYHTMRYRFDDHGVQMRWGILFRREINLTYARIQDIHLTSNFVERWLGLARIQIQTASGSASAEMTIEGVKEYETVRDFLYGRMRGMRDPGATARPAEDGLVRILGEVAEAMNAVREALERLEARGR
jgi:membrane protein YdbS with pleckstrin-like domain